MTSLFNEENDPVTIDPNKDYFSELVGEGKKYKDTLAAGRAIMEKDAFIDSLKREQNQIREDYMKLHEEYKAGASLRELIDQLKNQQQTSSDTHHNANVVNDSTASIDPKQIESLVSSQLQKLEATNREQANYNFVKDKLTERFGSNYKEALRQHSENLGMSAEYIDDMARKAPKALLKALGVEEKYDRQQNSFQAPPATNVRSFQPSVPEQRTWSYYQELRKKDPKKYYDPKTQVQLHKDAMALGESFEDGDWEQLGKF
jgi:hypothetical protein